MDRHTAEEALGSLRTPFLTGTRWFRHKLAKVSGLHVLDWTGVPEEYGGDRLLLTVIRYAGAGDYFVPLIIDEVPMGQHGPGGACPYGVLRDGRGIYDAATHLLYVNMVAAMADSGESVDGQGVGGRFEFMRIRAAGESSGACRARAAGEAAGAAWQITRVGDAYTNTVAIARRGSGQTPGSAFKTFRLLVAGPNPDIEVGRALCEAGCDDTPCPQGEVTYVDQRGVSYSVAAQTEEIPNIGDAWELTGRALDEMLSSPDCNGRAGCIETEQWAASDQAVRLLGATIARVHAALASVDKPGFGAIDCGPEHVRVWDDRARFRSDSAMTALRAAVGSYPPDEETGRGIRRVLENEQSVRHIISTAAREGSCQADNGKLIRCHGDLHLGQALVRPDNSFAIIDFEGEPLAPLEERRAPSSPARDIAGMLRSFGYAAQAAALRVRPADRLTARDAMAAWEQKARGAFLEGYLSESSATKELGISSRRLLPADAVSRDALIARFELEKALYEIVYELNNRPHWVMIPIMGVLSIVEQHGINRK